MGGVSCYLAPFQSWCSKCLVGMRSRAQENYSHRKAFLALFFPAGRAGAASSLSQHHHLPSRGLCWLGTHSQGLLLSAVGLSGLESKGQVFTGRVKSLGTLYGAIKGPDSLFMVRMSTDNAERGKRSSNGPEELVGLCCLTAGLQQGMGQLNGLILCPGIRAPSVGYGSAPSVTSDQPTGIPLPTSSP